MLRSIVAALLAVLVVVLAQPATAQLSLDTAEETIPTLPDPLTPEAARELVSRLSDADVRALLLDRLDAVAAERAATAAGDSIIDRTGEIAADTVDNIAKAITELPATLEASAAAIARFFAPRGWDGLATLVGAVLLALAFGALAEMAIDRIAGRWRSRTPLTHDSLRHTLAALARRAVFDVIGLVVFYLVVRAAVMVLLSDTPPPAADGTRSYPDTQIAMFFVEYVIILPRAIRTLTRFLMAPARPEMRLIHTDDRSARFMHRQMTLVFAIWGLMSFLIPFLASHGAQMGEYRLGFWLNAAAFAVLLYSTVRVRPGLSAMLIGHEADVTPAERRFAAMYPWIGIALIVAAWFVIEALVSQRLFGAVALSVLTLIVLLFAPVFDTAVRGLVRHLVPPMEGTGPVAEAAHARTKRSYIRIGRIVITWLVIATLTRIWGLDWTTAATGLGAQFAERAIEVVYILLAGYLVWELVALWINRKLAAEQTALGIDPTQDEIGGEGGGTGGSRLSTVLPLILGVCRIAILTVFALIALGHIGLDITPLLAGAGIVGLAIGFGAQKLVTDVVSGVFFLIDDAFRTGEYVEVEETFGTVEKISLRSMQLRHHKGPVHTIPYGEIPKLTNYSRDWVIVKLKFTVPFETDPNKVKKIFKQIGKEMMEVPEYAADLLQPFKSQGVFDFDDVGMIIRGKFMARPGRQFVLRKEIFNRVKTAFEANGIMFARREVRVAIPGLESAQLTEGDKEAIAAAAGDAAEQAAGSAPSKGG